MTRAKEVIEDGNKAIEEFKSTTHKRRGQLAEEGAVVTLVEEKVNTINAEITKLSNQYQEIEKRANRPQMGGGSEAEAKALKSFNAAAKSHAVRLNKPLPAEVTPDQYGAYKSAFDKAMRQNVHDLTAEEHKALSVGSNPDGG